MARWTRLICLLVIAALAVCFARVARELPLPKQGLVQEKFARWGGVLRLWVCEGWESGNGSLAAWLNAVSERFERRRDGVYVQAIYVSEAALRAFAYGAENPPDMILFAPGMLDSGDDLIPTDLSLSLRREFHGYADGLALPVAMGGYAWAVNLKYAPGGAPDGQIFAIEPTQEYRAWPLAALNMLTGTIVDAHGEARDARGGVDLGLPAPEEPEDEREYVRRPLATGEGSALTPDAYKQFVGGHAGAIVATQREIQKLRALSDAGRGPDWAIAFTGRAYTDQLALIGIVRSARADADERARACEEFLRFAVSEDGQKLLYKSRAFQVTDAPAIYTNQTGMAQLESALMQNELALTDAWRAEESAGESADGLLARVFAGEIDAQAALDALARPP